MEVAACDPLLPTPFGVLPARNRLTHLLFAQMLFGTFDGHSGWHTSRLLSTQLASYIAQELDLVFRGAPPYAALSPHPAPPAASPSSRGFWPFTSPAKLIPAQPSGLDEYDPVVQAALKNAFEKLDDEIVNAPVRLLEQRAKAGKGKGEKGKMGTEENEALHTLLPALSGSCALLAFLDAGRDKLHVAVTGDSRAVMGTWEPGPDGGRWRAEALSADQTGKSLSEVERIRSLHPASEAETVIARGRVLGSLEPSRAFGDARYKWPVGMQEKLAEAFHPGSIRGRPRNYLTPPYVTAVPEVVTVNLKEGIASPSALTASPATGLSTLATFLPGPSSASPAPPQATRFLVLATDGLYDRLNNDEVVALVGAHLSGVRGNQGRAKILKRVSTNASLAGAGEVAHAPRQEPTRGEGDAFSFEDGNLSTHLIRNALGGAKREQVSVLLSIPSPLSRRYRDDVSRLLCLSVIASLCFVVDFVDSSWAFAAADDGDGCVAGDGGGRGRGGSWRGLQARGD